MKNNIFRIVVFITAFIFGFTGPLWVFVLTVLLYSFVYFGIEIIFIAVAVDAYFGYTADGYYMYTVCTAGVLFLAQYLKPKLFLYNR